MYDIYRWISTVIFYSYSQNAISVTIQLIFLRIGMWTDYDDQMSTGVEKIKEII
jgi:hypothetical protein